MLRAGRVEDLMRCSVSAAGCTIQRRAACARRNGTSDRRRGLRAAARNGSTMRELSHFDNVPCRRDSLRRFDDGHMARATVTSRADKLRNQAAHHRAVADRRCVPSSGTSWRLNCPCDEIAPENGRSNGGAIFSAPASCNTRLAVALRIGTASSRYCATTNDLADRPATRVATSCLP